jgi:hypothetical protein
VNSKKVNKLFKSIEKVVLQIDDNYLGYSTKIKLTALVLIFLAFQFMRNELKLGEDEVEKFYKNLRVELVEMFTDAFRVDNVLKKVKELSLSTTVKISFKALLKLVKELT